jgi:hypothetical protein
MATKKSIKSDPSFGTAIAPVEAALATWRRQRPRQEPIPQALWKRIVPLARRYGLSPIAQALKVNYQGLQRHVAASVCLPAGPVSPIRVSSGFVEVPVSGWPSAAPWMIELEDGAGCKLTLRTAPCDSITAMTVAQGLWTQRA